MDKLSKSPRLNYLLRQMGIWSYYDVINHLPRRYEDLSCTRERNLEDREKVTVFGHLASAPKTWRKKGLDISSFDFLTEGGTFFRCVAFNRPYLSKILTMEDGFTLSGVYSRKDNKIDVTNLHKGRIDPKEAIKPVYSLPNDYPNHLFSNLVKKSLEEVKGKVFSMVPYLYMNKYRLVNRETALRYAHFPENREQVRQSLRYLKYEEALMFSVKNQIIHEENKSVAKIRKEPIDLSVCQKFLDSLPFPLTEDQRKASEEIIEDMNQSALMYRLLQGDVGTGKTLVSFIALYANYRRGDQGALMAPTDALAKQHYENAVKYFSPMKMKVALLTGSTPASEKRRIHQDLEDGTIDIVIGTHALFSKSCNYSSLGLVIVDEQHRFGVNQRIALSSKGEHADLLMMSATPIPRSLALTIYGDLEISTLYVFPNRKRDVTTEIVSSEDERIYQVIDNSLKESKEIYIIAPLIDFREDGKYNVEKLYARFLLRYGAKVGLLHGKMKPEEKEATLEAFYDGSKPILVSTQVVEVGIDVKSANAMIIYDASHFGLASLHQLRGRIGRDGSKATCLLTIDDDDEEAMDRLKILTDSNDGFAIAEQDMKARGPGDLTGYRQSGIPEFLFLNIIDDFKIFTVAREDAREIISHPENKGNKFLLDRAKREIAENEVTKG